MGVMVQAGCGHHGFVGIGLLSLCFFRMTKFFRGLRAGVTHAARPTFAWCAAVSEAICSIAHGLFLTIVRRRSFPRQ